MPDTNKNRLNGLFAALTLAAFVSLLLPLSGCGLFMGDKIGGNSIVLDRSGNIYVLGFFRGAYDFDPGRQSEQRVSKSDYDVFLSKFDPSGNFEWVATWEGASRNPSPYSSCLAARCLAADMFGNVYIGGEFWGTIDFDSGSGTDLHSVQYYSTGSINSDLFVMSLNPDGSYRWTMTWGGDDAEEVRGIVPVDGDTVWVTGLYKGNVDFDPGAGVTNSYSPPLASSPTFYNMDNGDTFLSRFDSDGIFQGVSTWETEVGLLLAESAFPGDSGRFYLSGKFDEPVDFDPSPDVFELDGSTDDCLFVSEFDSSGAFQNAVKISRNPINWGYVNTVAGDGRILIGGSCDPGQKPAWKTSRIIIPAREAYLSLFDPSGAHLWTVTYGAGVQNEEGATVDIVGIDNSGSIYAGGTFKGNLDFDPGNGTAFRNAPNRGAYLLKLDSNGDFQWVQSWNTLAIGDLRDMAFDGNGNIYIAGIFRGALYFHNGTTASVGSPSGYISEYLLRFDSQGNLK
jgi:hypothetical protein